MGSFINLVSVDIVQVTVQIPGRKLTEADRFGDGDDKLCQRVIQAKNVMKKYLSAEVCERDRDRNYEPWKELFMLELGKVPVESLVQIRQLALDLGMSNVEELFASEIGDTGDASDLPGSDEVRAFLAAKDVLQLPLSHEMGMCFA